MKPSKEQVISWAQKACGDPAWGGGVEWTWDEVQRFAVLAYEAGIDASPAAKNPDPKLALWNFKHNRLAGPSDDRAEVAVIRQREWQGLTDEEKKEIIRQQKDFWGPVGWELECTKAIEAKLKEKNGL